MEEQHEPSGISRRQIIKRAGIGAAAVWVAPAVISASSSFAAAGSTVCTGKESDCGPAPACGEGTGVNGFACVCVGTVEGHPFCRQGQQRCSCTQTDIFPSCASTSECDPGWACIPMCVTDVCADRGGVCFPQCGVLSDPSCYA